MKREIKLRGYSKKLNSWLIGGLFNASDKYYIIPKGLIAWGVNVDRYEVDPDSVGQYTNLNIENSNADGNWITELYEGDKLEITCLDPDAYGHIQKANIVFYNGAWYIDTYGVKSLLSTELENNLVRVVGNVYQNGEYINK